MRSVGSRFHDRRRRAANTTTNNPFLPSGRPWSFMAPYAEKVGGIRGRGGRYARARSGQPNKPEASSRRRRRRRRRRSLPRACQENTREGEGFNSGRAKVATGSHRFTTSPAMPASHREPRQREHPIFGFSHMSGTLPQTQAQRHAGTRAAIVLSGQHHSGVVARSSIDEGAK